MAEPGLVISCEHAVNTIPHAFQKLFDGREGVLSTHRGFDPGALDLALYLADNLLAPCFTTLISRLLVDHNRSPQSHSLWSEFSDALPQEQKQKLLDSYYLPFRAMTGDWIHSRISRGCGIIHLSVHSFTPTYNGKIRDFDIGVLYVPSREKERDFGRAWQANIKAARPDLKVRLNQPYRGTADCHQATYRHAYSTRQYLALELEVNQRLLNKQTRKWQNTKTSLLKTFKQTFAFCFK
ncbi:MAG: N-formylglutamate amidohydrolase [Deltaproteobacteria bacterium]|jgi:predicted N-formylglutamate amidohydrolase|nr:N-formylglutamate amidohydrolase [Deltaproteobacteria bacterium]